MTAQPASAWKRSFRPVLLVDDRSWDREAIARELAGHRFRCLTQPGVARALALCAAPEVAFEALVVPFGLDGQDGTGAAALAREARARRPALPVLVVGAPAGAPGADGLATCAGQEPTAVRAALEALLAATPR